MLTLQVNVYKENKECIKRKKFEKERYMLMKTVKIIQMEKRVRKKKIARVKCDKGNQRNIYKETRK